jgi:hypothetical protein
VGLWALLSCGGGPKSETPVPAPTVPLPTTGIAGQPVGILPLTLVAAEDTLHWKEQIGDRRAALARSDSIIGALLEARAPEVAWVLPEQMRRAAHRASGVAPDPDRMATAILRAESITQVPDPLRSQLRTLAAVAGSGGRYVLVPAALVYRRSGGQADRRSAAEQPTARPSDRPTATAELSVVLVDVRTGQVGFRTVARGEGDDPWTALERAVKSLTPGLP